MTHFAPKVGDPQNGWVVLVVSLGPPNLRAPNW